jgi:hypothetical protein
MKTFIVTFNTETHAAEEQIQAATPEQALSIALKIMATDTDALWFQPFDPNSDIQEISVADEHGNDRCRWLDDDWCFRRVMYSLLEAARELAVATEPRDLAKATTRIRCIIETLDELLAENHAIARSLP